MLFAFLSKLLNMSLTASVVILFVLLLRFPLKRAPKIISYALWGIVLFRLLCPISIVSSFSLFGLLDAPAASSGGIASRLEYIPDTVPSAYPQEVFPVTDALEAGTGVPTQDEWQPYTAASSKTPAAIAAYVWSAGVLAMAGYAAFSYVRLRRKLVTASRLSGNIYLADSISSPFVLGLIRPKIYIPSSLEDRELPYIIMHERHHVKRLDHITKALAFAALCIHWFNPLVWLAFAMAGKDMEMSCDEAVVKKMGDGILADYTSSLLSLATGKRVIAGMPLAFGEGDTKGRIRNLANWKRPAFWVVLAAAAACAVLAVCLLTNPAVNDSYIKFAEQYTSSGGTTAEYEADFGGKNLSGSIYAEQWIDGSCVRSAPVAFTQYLGDIHIQLRTRREDGVMVGTDVQIDTDQYGGSLITYFEHPQEKTVSGWSFIAYEENEKISVAGVKEIILASMAFDTGSGVYVYDCETLLKEPERLNRGEHIIIRICFDDASENIPVQGENTLPAETAESIYSTSYVSYQCLYMNPLSSYYAIGGDSGCIYRVGEDYFETVTRSGSVQDLIEVPQWEWQPFPYTEEEWEALYIPETGAAPNITELYGELFYQPLTADRFLLRADGDLLLVDLAANEQMGTYIWSIYSLVPESAMGTAQWECSPGDSSGETAFRFTFDISYTDISAVCSDGNLTYFEDPGQLSEHGLDWSPTGKDGNISKGSAIFFTVHSGGEMVCAGTIYIGASGEVYTASLVGTGLHLSQGPDGGVISLAN